MRRVQNNIFHKHHEYYVGLLSRQGWPDSQFAAKTPSRLTASKTDKNRIHISCEGFEDIANLLSNGSS